MIISFKMIYRQYVILIFLYLFSIPSKASWTTEPYLGYGQLSLALGNKTLVKGEGVGYILGARTGWQLGSLFIGGDYSRNGPFKVTFRDRVYGTSITSGLFTIFSGGVGAKYSFGSWMLWVGTYPYHVLEEHRIDFQLKGTMNRYGLGFVLDSKLNIYFQFETSNIQMSNPNSATLGIICYGSGSSSDCPHTGSTDTISFILSSTI